MILKTKYVDKFFSRQTNNYLAIAISSSPILRTVFYSAFQHKINNNEALEKIKFKNIKASMNSRDIFLLP